MNRGLYKLKERSICNTIEYPAWVFVGYITDLIFLGIYLLNPHPKIGVLILESGEGREGEMGENVDWSPFAGYPNQRIKLQT